METWIDIKANTHPRHKDDKFIIRADRELIVQYMKVRTVGFKEVRYSRYYRNLLLFVSDAEQALRVMTRLISTHLNPQSEEDQTSTTPKRCI